MAEFDLPEDYPPDDGLRLTGACESRAVAPDAFAEPGIVPVSEEYQIDGGVNATGESHNVYYKSVVETTSPEVTRAVVYDQCLARISALLDGGQEIQSHTPFEPHNAAPRVNNADISPVLDIIFAAVADNNPAVVEVYARYIDTIPQATVSDRVEARFAAAVMGDTAAADTVHGLLSAERTARMTWREQVTTEEAYHPPRQEPQPQLYQTIIRRCAEYGLPADSWIETYATDPHEAWTQKAGYLVGCIRQADTAGGDTGRFQELLEAHVARMDDLPPGTRLRIIPLVVEHVKDQTVRDRLIDEYIAQVQYFGPHLSILESMSRIGAQLMSDPQQAQGIRARLLWDMSNVHARQLLRVRDYQEVIDRLYPIREAWMRRAVASHEVIRLIDQLANHSLRHDAESVTYVNGEPDNEAAMQLRETRLYSSVSHFVSQGDFVAAQAAVEAMGLYGDMRLEAACHCIRMASDPGQLALFEPEATVRAAQPRLAAAYDIARLRITGNIKALISLAVHHAVHFVPAGDEASLSLAEVNAVHHFSICEIQAAIEAADAAQLPVYAKQLLPVMRATGWDFSTTRPLSRVLLAADDPDEPYRAWRHLHDSLLPMSEDIGSRGIAHAVMLGQLMHDLHRAGQAVRNQSA